MKNELKMNKSMNWVLKIKIKIRLLIIESQFKSKNLQIIIYRLIQII
jgi:hypothetical protein